MWGWGARRLERAKEQYEDLDEWASFINLFKEDPVNWDAVQMKMERHPEVCATADSSRRMMASPPLPQPLFLAIEKDAPTSIIEKLLVRNPDAARVRQFRTGLTPLFLAVSKGTDIKIIRLLLEVYPEAASQSAFNGCIALHSATTIEVAELLLKAYPQGVRHCNDQGYLPLHRAVYSAWPRPEVVRLLIEVGIEQKVGGKKGRGGVFMKTTHGVTPLTMICDVLSNKKGVENDIDIWTKFCHVTRAAVGEEDTKSFKILHATVSLGCPDQIISSALVRHPEQISEYDSHGCSALSYAAMEKDSSSEVLQMLLDADCSMASKMDRRTGRLPLHHIVDSGRPYGEGMEAIIRPNHGL